jgi:release factor glutamine methyltransferase
MIIRELLGLARALAAESAPVAADAVTVESVARDAEVLLCHCLGKSRSYLYTWPEQAVQPAAEARYRELLALRQAGHPVAHLTGRRDFWSLDLEVSPSTLRP